MPSMEDQDPFRSYYTLPGSQELLFGCESVSDRSVLDHDDAESVQRRRASRAWIPAVVIGLLIAVVGNLGVAYWLDQLRMLFRFSYWFYSCLGAGALGLKLSECNCCSVMMGIGPGPFTKRFLIVGFVSLLLNILFVLGLQLIGAPGTIVIFILLISSGVILSMAFFYGFVFRMMRVELKKSGNESLPVKSNQFNIRLLFSIMLGVAICIPMVKAAIPSSRMGSDFPVAEATLWMVWLTIAMSLFAIVQLFAMLSQIRLVASIVLASLMIFGPFLFQQVSQFLCSGTRLSFRNDVSIYLVAYAMTLGFALGNSWLFFILRKFGYLIRRK